MASEEDIEDESSTPRKTGVVNSHPVMVVLNPSSTREPSDAHKDLDNRQEPESESQSVPEPEIEERVSGK